MARRSKDQEPVIEKVEEVVPIATESVEEPISTPAPEPEPIPEKPTIDLESELAIAHAEIQHCIDYTCIPGADYAGYYRGKQKEWQMYAYKIRQYALRGGNPPERPAPVESKY